MYVLVRTSERTESNRIDPKRIDNNTPQMGKALQPQIVAGALACMDLVCSAGFDRRYAFAAGESAGNAKANTKLYT